MHRFGYRILCYLDDWLILGSSLQEIVRARDFFVMALQGTMGSIEPFQEFSHTDSDLRLSRHDSSVNTFEGFPDSDLDPEGALSRRRVLLEQPLSLWRSLLGVMSSMSTLIPGSHLRMQSLQLRFNVAGPQASEDALISWDDSCHLDLQWWSVASHLDWGVSLDFLQLHRLLFTDASDSCWGLHLGEDRLSGLWSWYVSTYSINHSEFRRFYWLSGVFTISSGISLSRCSQATLPLCLICARRGA